MLRMRYVENTNCVCGQTDNINRGFTLIELIVVISTLAFLISLLIPAINAARNNAKRVICASNLRQWGLAFELYKANNDSHYPAPFTEYFDTYVIRLTPYLEHDVLQILSPPTSTEARPISYRMNAQWLNPKMCFGFASYKKGTNSFGTFPYLDHEWSEAEVQRTSRGGLSQTVLLFTAPGKINGGYGSFQQYCAAFKHGSNSLMADSSTLFVRIPISWEKAVSRLYGNPLAVVQEWEDEGYGEYLIMFQNPSYFE